MATEILASYSKVETSVSRAQFASQQQTLSVKAQKPPQQNLFNAQQSQIIDELGISEEAVKKLQEAQALAVQLQDYLDYLNGGTRPTDVRLTALNEEASVEIQGRSTELAASITVATYSEDRLDIAANFDDNGDLTSLSIQKTSIQAEYIQTSASLSDAQFYARA